MKFSADKALEYARALARPRRVGCGEDEAVADEIANRLAQMGYRVGREPFEFHSALGAFIGLEILTCLVLIVGALCVWEWKVWSSALAGGLLIFLGLTSPLNRAIRRGCIRLPADHTASFWSTLCARLGRRHVSANLVASLPDDVDDPALPCLYLVAHYDSKSQRLPLAARIVLYVVALAGVLAFAALTWLRLVVPEAAPAAVASGLVAVLAGVPLLLLQDVGNASRGAIDNASGVGLVLHLAECLTVGSEWRGKLCVKVLITGAEEWGVMGATAYVRAHAGELQRQAGAGGLHILNFDGVGIRGQLRHVGAGRGRLLDFVRAACRESGLAIRGFKFVGALADHIPFAEEGLDALSLITMGRAAWSVHTRHDSADKLDAEGFRKAGEVAQGVVKWLARGPAPGSPRWSGL